jgi:glycosyltransferase involved in cell wall biosynthesis
MARDIGFPRERITVIRNGADLQKFGATSRTVARELLGIASGDFVIGTVGRLVPVKDHVVLLSAIAGVNESGVAASMVIVGDGPLRGDLESRAHALGLERQVLFLGHRPDVDRILPALDVFALTSVSEGLPNTVLEAMATGLPVISTDVGGVDELVVDGETGLLVPARDAGAFSAAILKLAGDRGLREEMGAKGRKRATAQFGLPTMLAGYARVYKESAGDITAGPCPSGRTTECAGSLVE